jgi:hypothetical protein
MNPKTLEEVETHNSPQPNKTPNNPQTQITTQKPTKKQKLCTHKNPHPQNEAYKNLQQTQTNSQIQQIR